MQQPDYKALFESVPGLYLVLDPELRIVAASDALLKATMTSREAIVGRPLFEAFPGKSDSQQRAVRGALEELRRTKTAQSVAGLKYGIARPAELGGGFDERYWSARYTPVLNSDGTLLQIVGAVEDVTGTEERYRSLFESIDAGFCVIEMIYDEQQRPVDYRFLEVNPAFERQTGLKAPLAKTMRGHVPDHEQYWFDTYANVAETGEPRRFVHAAKALMGGWYEVYAYRVGGAGSRMVAVLFNDITERVRAVEALKETDRRKDEFLATLAHELRNPLAPIRNALTIMRLKGGLEPQLATARELIERQVSHLVRLVDDLLDVSRVTFGKVELRRERLDLRSVAEHALATSKPELDDAGHRVTVRMAAGALWVDGDAVRLTQVISNILNNAARYTPRGGAIALEVGRDDGHARVTVEDNGVGIAPEMLERVFDPFVQGGAVQGGSPREGIGIGLSLARKLTELHGGRISAASRGAGQGSRFTVELPLADVAAELPRTQPSTATGARHRFLVVDDNVDAAASQAQLLRMLGHEAETADSGEAALRTAAHYRPKVVLLDLGMPGMDGYACARELRRMPELDGATLIAQTGWNQDEDRRRTAAAGFDAHLAKPVDIDALLREVDRLSAT
jgi:PAS domain S-box-containing protein